MKIPTALTAIFLAAINFAGVQNTGTNAAASPPREGDNVTAAGWTHHHRQATGAAVKAGLIPNLKPLNPNTQRRDTIVILGGSGNYYPGGGGTDYFQDQEGN